MIRIKYENSWYGYQGMDGFALYIDGKKMHIGLFHRISCLREYWHTYQYILQAGIIPDAYRP